MKTNNSQKLPNYLFEISWEVCNKVGGIHTVIASKAPLLIKELKSNYITIGPDLGQYNEKNPSFIEDKQLMTAWKRKTESEGLNIRIGYWDISKRPIAILINFSNLAKRKDDILSEFWNEYKLDSLSGEWDYIEPTLFSYAAGQVIESFVKFNVSQRETVVAQCHEWMMGGAVLYLKKHVPSVATTFTTHATVLGRAIAGNGQPLYSKLSVYDSNLKAKEFNVSAKQSMEKLAAQKADSFTTVSEITNKECFQFLNKKADLITPNGFDSIFTPQGAIYDEKREFARNKMRLVAECLSGSKISSDALFLVTSGRYEFKNKGVDLFIDALVELNKSEELKKEVVAYLLIPSNNAGFKHDLYDKVSKNDISNGDGSISSHYLHDEEHDAILNRLKKHNFKNCPENKVKIVFVPCYLNANDGIFNILYYDMLIGFDLSVFPSYYEPWGYTPLESLAFKIPTITTSLTGFGDWIKQKELDNAVFVLKRTDTNDSELTANIAKTILKYSKLSKAKILETKDTAFALFQEAQWTNFINYYYRAYEIALNNVKNIVKKTSNDELTNYSYVDKLIKANEPSWKSIKVQKNLPAKLYPLEEMSKNLWWCWNEEAIELYSNIDKALWEECERNPIVLLNKIPYQTYVTLENDKHFLTRLEKVYNLFQKYMKRPARKNKPKVAYFSMEFGLHESLKIYSGGLGILAGDYLKEASDSNFDIIGVGLLYRHGYFKQVISQSGEQIAVYEKQPFSNMPVIPVHDENGNWKTINIAFPGRILSARIWVVQVGKIPLYLLDTDFAENMEQDRNITYELYGGTWENRFKQEMLLGVGGIRLLKSLGIKPDIYHCNEGHAAFIGVERLRHFIKEHSLTFEESLEIVRASTLFTTHTPVPAGHDAFDEDVLKIYMSHYAHRLRITWTEFMSLGKITPTNPYEKFSMSHLAANVSQEINGVSRLHGRVSQEIFQDLYRGYMPEELHIGYVTNGVHVPTWMAKDWKRIYEKYINETVVNQPFDNKVAETICDSAGDDEIWNIREKLRGELISHIQQMMKSASMKYMENPKLLVKICDTLDSKVLTIGFARRFATYKRAHLLFSDLERLSKIVNNPQMPVQFLFAGKAHPADKAGQDLIKMIVEMSRRPEFIGRILMLEGYDIQLAKKLVQGVDVWLNTPTRPLEASGTSGEKAVMNGVLHFSVLDGWWAEGYVKDAGWMLPEEQVFENNTLQDQLDSETLYSLIEDEIATAFYKREDGHLPKQWVGYIKNSLRKVCPNFTMTRQINDYESKYYDKMYARKLRILANDYNLAKEMAIWKKHISRGWDSIEVIEISNPSQVIQGETYQQTVILDLNELNPEDIGVELVVVEPHKDDNKRKVKYTQEFKMTKFENKNAHFKISVSIPVSGTYEYGIRIFAKHKELPNRQDFNYVRWI